VSDSLLWSLSTAIVFVSAGLQSMTGFGFAVLAVPLLVTLHDPIHAVGICMVLSTLSVLLMWWRTRRHEKLPINGRLFVAALVGLPFGLLALNHLDLAVLRISVGAITLAIAALSALPLLRARFVEPELPAALGLRPTLIAGFVSGFLTGSLSMPGPPVVALLNGQDLGKAAYRSTLAAYFALIYPIALFVMIVEGTISRPIAMDSLTHVPAMVVGMLLGDVLHRASTRGLFATSSLVLLAAAGVVCLATGIQTVVGG
jgi:uncharacterized membrane protein YfcA